MKSSEMLIKDIITKILEIGEETGNLADVRVFRLVDMLGSDWHLLEQAVKQRWFRPFEPFQIWKSKSPVPDITLPQIPEDPLLSSVKSRFAYIPLVSKYAFDSRGFPRISFPFRSHRFIDPYSPKSSVSETLIICQIH